MSTQAPVTQVQQTYAPTRAPRNTLAIFLATALAVVTIAFGATALKLHSADAQNTTLHTCYDKALSMVDDTTQDTIAGSISALSTVNSMDACPK